MSKTISEKIAVMAAAARGEKIQMTSLSFPRWIDIPTPKWNWEELDYRVKPKPQKFWVIFNQQNRVLYAGEVKPNIHLYKDCVLEEYERPSK